MKRLLILSTLLLTNAAFAADDFKSVVKAVETNYGIHHKHIPMIGSDDEVHSQSRIAEHETRDF